MYDKGCSFSIAFTRSPSNKEKWSTSITTYRASQTYYESLFVRVDAATIIGTIKSIDYLCESAARCGTFRSKRSADWHEANTLDKRCIVVVMMSKVVRYMYVKITQRKRASVATLCYE